MARLTDRERNLIQEARRTSGWPAWEETDAIILAARQARAKTIARWIRQGLAPLAGAVAAARSVTGRSILPLRRDLLRRRTVNELYRLDDRILADIGIVREQIEPTAADLAQAALPPSKPRVGLVSRLGLWRRRRAAIRELEALDDRLLDDIGLRRPEIREAVQRAAAEALVAPAVEGAPNAALPAPRSWPPVRLITRLFGFVRRWLQRWDTTRKLEALDDRMLADIGLLRREIPTALDRPAASSRRAAAAPTLEQANYWDSVVHVLRNWETSREAARETLRGAAGTSKDRGGATKKFNPLSGEAAKLGARQHRAA